MSREEGDMDDEISNILAPCVKENDVQEERKTIKEMNENDGCSSNEGEKSSSSAKGGDKSGGFLMPSIMTEVKLYPIHENMTEEEDAEIMDILKAPGDTSAVPKPMKESIFSSSSNLIVKKNKRRSPTISLIGKSTSTGSPLLGSKKSPSPANPLMKGNIHHLFYKYYVSLICLFYFLIRKIIVASF
jgi:hypothetical protein